MSQLKSNLQEIYAEKQAKIIPENIKKDVQIFDIVGTLETGLDTSSDNPITASDVASGKEGFVNGEKVTGTVAVQAIGVNSAWSTNEVTRRDAASALDLTTYISVNNPEQPRLFKGNNQLTLSAHYEKVAEVIGLTPEKLVAGNTIIGVEGTATSLDTSDATATIKDILENKTAYVNGEKLTGTMANNGDLVVTPNTDEQDHSAGYYNSVQVRPVTATVDEDIKAENIKSGVSILGVSGTVTELNGHELEVTPATEQKIITPEENYNAITKVTVDAVTSSIDSNIKSENIKSGVEILGVTGTLQEGLDTSDATATADDISLNKTAYVNGQKVTGNLPLFPNTRTFTVDNAGVTNNVDDSQLTFSTINTLKQTLDSNLNMKFSANYTDIATAIGLTADKIKSGETILGITGTYTGTSE